MIKRPLSPTNSKNHQFAGLIWFLRLIAVVFILKRYLISVNYDFNLQLYDT